MDVDYDNELNICIDCLKDTKLKKYILSCETKKYVCSFCQKEHDITLDIYDNDSFDNFLRALIRYYFWEEEYNRHFGGDDFYRLIKKNNLILNHERIIENYLFENIERDALPISLYAGHIDGWFRLSFGERYKDKRDEYLSVLEERLLSENYFLLEDEFKEKILSYVEFFESSIFKKDIYYRARIGYKELIKNDYSDCDYTDKDASVIYKPYIHRDIGAPPPKITSAGRLNRLGVSFLYLATDRATALSEVRPHPGDKVSIGCFKSLKELKIVDFDIAFLNLSNTEEELEKFIFLNHIDQLLSKPITPSERHLYLITQFFADIFRKIGFDGIQFSSSVGEGQNILIFDPSNFEYIEENASVHEIKSLHYKSKKLS